MRIVVCIKEVIDVTFPFDLTAESCEPVQDDIFYVVNPADLCALQLALRVKETRGGEVVLVALGSPRVQKSLRHCLALGGDRAIQIGDENLKPDGQVTSFILSKVMEGLAPDLILCGSRSVDKSSGEVGPCLAEYLKLPQVTGVTAIDSAVHEDRIVVERKLERGRRAKLECPLPAVLAVEAGLERPAYAPLPRILDAAGAEITTMDWKSLGIDSRVIQRISSGRRLLRLSLPRPRPKKVFSFDSGLSAEERMELMMSGGLQDTKSDLLQGKPEELADKMAEILLKEVLGRK